MGALRELRWIGRGLLFAALGFLLGAAGARGVAGLTGRSEVAQIVVTLGYVGALLGWLLGVGLWDVWVREWVGLPARSLQTQGWSRFFRFNTDHKVIGVQYLVTFVALLLLAGLLAVIMRVELATPGRDLLSARDFNTTMSLHGIIMIAVAVATIIGGFANFAVPLLIGAEDVAFPRVNALSYWIIPPVAVLLILTPFFGGFDTGWTAYPPLSVVNATGGLLFLLAFLTFGLSSILGGLNFITTIVKLRAPGMTWSRLPIFVWSILAAAIISLTATQFVAYGLLMVILDRVVGTGFFDAARGGNALLYEHVFWFYSHPAVYIMILPAFGIWLEVLTHFSRKPLFAYKLVVGAFLSIVVISYLVWAHHLFTSGMQNFLHLPFMVVTELISIPTGIVFLAALGTIWRGRLWLTTPMLFALALVFNFLIGGLTGIFLADVATDIQLQDTYFVVAHFHYTIMGGEIFAIFAGIYYWFPKITGRMFNERLGRLHFWWMFILYQITFIPMFWVGIQGMNRRVADYAPNLGGANQFISIATFLLGASFLVFVVNMVYSWLRGPVAGANPWRARTLDWQTSSPPPVENFQVPPHVVGYPYDYGVPGSVHAVVGVAGGAVTQEEAAGR
ncbi:MAG: cbb3-type cytochrome c oxidase subunit I [Chloroflexi bacterium]|nr:cbb3-type cytochrome c oxidase subunit I [Chloroflexota bacterium]